VSGPRVVIAAGGTAGHVVPAIAVADALRAEGADVRFAGGQRAEAELVPAAGYELDALDVEGISRTNPLKAARAATKAVLALGGAGRLLRRHRADVVLGGGGYVAGPVGLAAVLRGTPLVLTEADSHLGLTNRLLAGRARRVCLAFPIDGRDGERYLLTGRPVPPTITDREGARARFGIAPGETAVLVFGGSLGARSINEAAVRSFAGAPYRVLHVAGRRDFESLEAPDESYVLRDYVVPFGLALAAADLAVARAGGSVFELAQYGLPALLVPYPHASGNHQAANARWMEQAGAATVVPDAELTPERLRAEVDALVADEPRRAAMAAASRRLARPDAAGVIAREVLRAADPQAGSSSPRSRSTSSASVL
jgi:UDP-N-acetylglucosamine--N-acetylmuramyl-(pentapeptide) pyrophosphoryl-undecaprenol N-acetylglucosamine transferase